MLVNDSLGRRRAFYGAGYEIAAFRGRRALAPYALLGAALGLSTDTAKQQLGVLWSAGGGLEWRPTARFAVGVEGRYRLEDRGPRGFWRPGPDARSGLGGSLGISIGIGRREAGGGRPAYSPAASPLLSPATVSGNAGDVVESALDALGTPYQWGGTADNGFDCSGLIQYAYGRHGIRLPRRSRDQGQVGAEVAPVVEALRPGDTDSLLSCSVTPANILAECARALASRTSACTWPTGSSSTAPTTA